MQDEQFDIEAHADKRKCHDQSIVFTTFVQYSSVVEIIMFQELGTEAQSGSLPTECELLGTGQRLHEKV